MRITNTAIYRQGIAAMQEQTQAVAKAQTQLSSGLKFQRAGESPVAAAQSLTVDKALADTAQWSANVGSAQDRLKLEEGALASVNDALSRIRELAIQANTSTLSDTDRDSIAKEMKERLQQVIDQANTRDGAGRYLFAGSSDQSRPFETVNGQVQYQGDSLVSTLSIGATREIALSDSGDAAFMALKSGDGRLDVAAASGNQGAAIAQDLHFSDSSLWDGGSYRIGFSAGQYSVSDATGNVVASGDYASQQAIQFRGVSLTLVGTPADGDSFSLTPSRTQDVFTTAQAIIDTVSAYGRSDAQKSRDQTTMFSALKSLDGAIDHISNLRGGVGARLNVLDDAADQLQARSVQLKESLSNLREVDYTEAAARLSQTETTLQAAQQSYLKIQGMSLFDYL